MKITIYELLGMIKDGKAPKKIKYGDKTYSFKDFLYKLEPSCLYPHIVTDDYVLYCNEINKYILNNYKIYDNINDEIEILEEEKKIPEKILVSKKALNHLLKLCGAELLEHNFDFELVPELNILESKGE